MLAREARVYARKELKAIVKQVSASKASRALAKEERARLMRIWLWETQRRYFRAYLKAAQAEQRAIRNALKRAKPGDLQRYGRVARRRMPGRRSRLPSPSPVGYLRITSTLAVNTRAICYRLSTASRAYISRSWDVQNLSLSR